MAIEEMHDGEPKWMGAEHCCLCKAPTHYWYLPNDVAVCQTCAETACDSDIPTKLEWLNAEGAKERSPGWSPHVEKFAASITLPQDVICLAKVVGQKGPAVKMIKVDIAQHLLGAERDKINQYADLKSQHIQSLEYMVGVYEARSEGKPIPKPQSIQLMFSQLTCAALPPDRVQMAVKVGTGSTQPVQMIAVEHLCRLLAGEDSRFRAYEYQLKTRIEGLTKELETYIQEGELA